MEEEISLQEIWDFIRDNIWSFILSTIIGAALAFLIMTLFVDPTYGSQAQLLVNQGTTNDEQPIQNAQIQANVQLINTYRDIILADSTLNEVNEQLGGDYTISELREALAVEQQPDSQAFVVRGVMESPEEAQNLVSSVVTVFEQQVQEAYSTNDPDIFILSPATYNPNRVAPNTLMYIVIGGLLGLMVSVGLQLIKKLSDTTIHDGAYVDSLGLVNLGEISKMSNSTILETRLGLSTNDSRRSRRKV